MDQPDLTPQPSPRLLVLPERKPFAGVPEVLKEFADASPGVRLAALGLCVINAGWPYLGRGVVALALLALAAWRAWLAMP